MRESGLGLNMEVQGHGQEELESFRPCWFPAVFTFAEVSNWRRCRSVDGRAHSVDFLSKVIGMTTTSSSGPKVHSPEVIVFPFFQSPLLLIPVISCVLSCEVTCPLIIIL